MLFEALYSTMHDILIICDHETEATQGAKGVHTSYLKPGMTVMDLTADLAANEFLRDAKGRDCRTVEPRQLFLHQLEMQAKMLTGKPTPRAVMEQALPETSEEEG